VAVGSQASCPRIRTPRARSAATPPVLDRQVRERIAVAHEPETLTPVRISRAAATLTWFIVPSASPAPQRPALFTAANRARHP
jgi:hypothetical protein